MAYLEPLSYRSDHPDGLRIDLHAPGPAAVAEPSVAAVFNGYLWERLSEPYRSTVRFPAERRVSARQQATHAYVLADHAVRSPLLEALGLLARDDRGFEALRSSLGPLHPLTDRDTAALARDYADDVLALARRKREVSPDACDLAYTAMAVRNCCEVAVSGDRREMAEHAADVFLQERRLRGRLREVAVALDRHTELEANC